MLLHNPKVINFIGNSNLINNFRIADQQIKKIISFLRQSHSTVYGFIGFKELILYNKWNLSPKHRNQSFEALRLLILLASSHADTVRSETCFCKCVSCCPLGSQSLQNFNRFKKNKKNLENWQNTASRITLKELALEAFFRDKNGR